MPITKIDYYVTHVLSAGALPVNVDWHGCSLTFNHLLIIYAMVFTMPLAYNKQLHVKTCDIWGWQTGLYTGGFDRTP